MGDQRLNSEACDEVIRLLKNHKPSRKQVERSEDELEKLMESQNCSLPQLIEYFMTTCGDRNTTFNSATGFEIQHALVTQFHDGWMDLKEPLYEQEDALPYLHLLYAFYFRKYATPHHPTPIADENSMIRMLDKKCQYLLGKSAESKLSEVIVRQVALFSEQGGKFKGTKETKHIYEKLLGEIDEKLLQNDDNRLRKVAAYKAPNTLQRGIYRYKRQLVEGIEGRGELGEMYGGCLSVNKKKRTFEIKPRSTADQAQHQPPPQSDQVVRQSKMNQHEYIDRLRVLVINSGTTDVEQIQDCCLKLCRLAWLNNVAHQNDRVEEQGAYREWNGYYQLAFSYMALLYCIAFKLDRRLRQPTSPETQDTINSIEPRSPDEASGDFREQSV